MMLRKVLPWLVLGLSCPVSALDFTFDNGVSVALDSTLTWGAQWRTEGRDDSITGSEFVNRLQDEPFLPLTDPEYSQAQTVLLNSNDGNNNFDKGLVSHRVTLLADLDINWENYGLFVRGKAFYDQVYQDNDTNLSGDDFRSYNSGTLYGGDAQPGEFPEQTQRRHGRQIEILDIFGYATWELPGDRLFDLRVGRQVINWGESTFYQGINSIQNRADQFAANTPGVEIREIFLPTGSVYAQIDVIPSLTLEAYYQYEWLENDLNGVGSYFATNDQVGPGSHAFLIPTPNSVLVPEEIRGNEFNLRGVLRTPDDNASDSGQWGMALHYVTEGGWDWGLYHAVGHDKKPSFVLEYIDVPGSPQPVPLTYNLRYYEDIRGNAVSFTTVVGNTNVQGEISLLDGTPMVNAAGDPEREKLAKLQVGGTHLYGPSFLADSVTLTFEGFYATVTSADSDELIGDDSALGYSLLADVAYNNVAQGWDLSIPIYFKHDVKGLIQEIQSFEKSKVLSLGLKGTYLNNLTVNMAYSFYFGGGDNNLLQDRDNVALNIKYGF
ncbi:DUF1302 family protein [Halieaceae bacterium IMCC14734]|uniref:DUF1302 family protein n=1 Tax=Candidatus Litorirhabdus singularis TaxID=2518993 RepID=A0ABT3TM25_9GAMM|nr:DUF1302 family protein [Candidatus Litorirhabdus singularis]MCX2983074.1 DUF1302 family protein [Candidatus Litorirhabdus singularis]